MTDSSEIWSQMVANFPKIQMPIFWLFMDRFRKFKFYVVAIWTTRLQNLQEFHAGRRFRVIIQKPMKFDMKLTQKVSCQEKSLHFYCCDRHYLSCQRYWRSQQGSYLLNAAIMTIKNLSAWNLRIDSHDTWLVWTYRSPMQSYKTWKIANVIMSVNP